MLSLFIELLIKYKLSVKQVDNKVEITHLIAKHIVNWRQLAKSLSLTESEISAISGSSEVEQANEMLEEWIRTNYSTYLYLIKVCLKANELELADKICQELHRLQGIYILY